MAKPYERTFADNPYASEGLKRRGERAAGLAELAAQPAQVYDPYEGNALAETTRAVVSNVVNDSTTGMEALGRGLIGDETGSRAAARRYQTESERIRGLGPDIQTFDDAKKAGGGVGDYAAAVGFQGAQIAADFTSSVATGGVGGLAAKTAAKSAIRRAATKDLTGFAANRGVFDQAKDEAVDLATKATRGPISQDAARVAARQGVEQVEDTIRRQVVMATGRTPRAVANAQKNGVQIGAAAGSVPSLNEANIDMLAKDDTDQSDVFKLAAGTAGAAAISALPAERFLSRFGDEATTAVRASAEKFLPRVTKEAVKQGLTEGSSEVLQEATQLASHKWVDDNIDLLGPEALNQYLTSFIAGSVAGGTIGAAGETGRATSDKIASATQGLGGKVRERLKEFGDSARAAFAAKRGSMEPGQPMGASDAPTSGAGSKIADLFGRASRAAKGYVDTATAAAKGASKSAGERFNAHFNDIVDNEDLDAREQAIFDKAQAFESGAVDSEAPPVPRAPNANPVSVESRLQNTLLAHIPRDNPMWGDPDAVKSVGTTLERAFRGDKLDIDDHLVLHAMVNDPASGVTRDTLDSWVASGRDYVELTAKASKMAEVEAEAEPEAINDVPDTAMAAAFRAARPQDNGAVSNDASADERDARLAEGYEPDAQQLEGEGDVVNDALTERTGLKDAMGKPPTPAESVANLQAAGTAIKARLDKAPTPALQKEYDDTVAAFGKAKDELRRSLLGGEGRSGSGALVVENRVGKGKEQWAAVEDDLANSPKRIEIEPVNVGDRAEIMRRRALSIDSLVNRYLNQVDDFDTSTADGQKNRQRAALFQVFGDLKSAGIKIKPSTIVAGDLGYAENGAYLGEISERDAKELRAMWAEGGDPKAAADARFAGEKPAKRTKLRNRRGSSEKALDSAYGEEHADDLMGENEIDRGSSSPGEVLAPRTAPPGGQALEGTKHRASAKNPDKSAPLDTSFVPTQGVRAVTGSDPLGDIARKARETARKQKLAGPDGEVRDAEGNIESPAVLRTGGVRADPRFKAGVDIGIKLLKQEFDAGNMSERRFAASMRKLENPESGLARKYYNDAYAGKYVQASVTEGKVDDAKIDRKAQREEGGFDDQLDEIAGDDDVDIQRDQQLVNAMLKALGIADAVTVESADLKGGKYMPKAGLIQMSSSLIGPERVEVLMHEVGHHILFSEIAKAAGIKLVDVPSGTHDWESRLELLAKHNPELHQALLTDFNAWKLANSERQNWKVTRAARAPLHRAHRVLASKAKTAPDDLYSFDEYIADNIARALTTRKEGRGVIGQFFKGIADQLRAAWRMLTGKEKKEWAPAPSVDAWVKSLFDQNKAAVSEVVGGPVTQAQAEAAVTAAVVDAQAKNDEKWVPDSLEEMTSFINLTMTTESRQILDRVLNRGVMVQALRKHYADNPAALTAIDDAKAGLENRIAYAYLAWQAGGIKVGPQGSGYFHKVSEDLGAIVGLAGDGDYAQRIFTDIASGRIAKLGAKYDVVKAEQRTRGKLQAAVNALGDLKAKISEPLSKAFEGKLKRMWDSGLPAMRELAALIHKPQGTTGDDHGYTPAVRDTSHRMTRIASAQLRNLKPKDRVAAMDMLQRRMTDAHPKWKTKSIEARTAVVALRKFFDQSYDYAKAAGLDVGKRELYFPVTFDTVNGRTRDTLTKLYSQPHFEAAIRDLPIFQIQDKDGNRLPDNDSPIEDLVKNLVDGAVDGEVGPATTGADAPNFRGENGRLSQFVYELGTEEDIKAFASAQSKNGAEVLARYIEPLVKRAEYVRRFGAKGETKARIFADLKAQGATDEQLGEAEDILKAALGTYGADGSPTLRALSPDLAKKFSGKKSRNFVEAGQAYQNARVLPLSLLSSLVDPMGIAVRTGGDFVTAWDGIKAGMSSLWNKDNRAEMSEALNWLGAADEIVPAMASTQGFDGAGNSKAQQVNEWVFKLNGMGTWVRATRFMALHAAHGFLLKHASGEGDTSSRYLGELGIEPGDIESVQHTSPDGRTQTKVKLMTDLEREGADQAEIDRDDRVRGALLQFVNEAVLRTNSQQTPLWHSDPYMGLVTQYKSFGYAIYDQIGGRISRELQHGNHKVVLAMLSYLPIVIMGEMLRGLIQYGMGGNPKRDDWGPMEYTMLGMERSGLFIDPAKRVALDAIQDAKAGRTPGSSQIGPTAGQAKNFVTTRDYGGAFEEALPGSAAYKRWNDDEPKTKAKTETPA